MSEDGWHHFWGRRERAGFGGHFREFPSFEAEAFRARSFSFKLLLLKCLPSDNEQHKMPVAEMKSCAEGKLKRGLSERCYCFTKGYSDYIGTTSTLYCRRAATTIIR